MLGRALGDPLRISILEELMGGPAAVSDLVAATGRRQPNVSNHLAVLREAGLVRQSRRGRQALYELRDASVAALIEAIVTVAQPKPRPTARATRVTPPLAAARTCYDHLAGRLGVAVFDALVRLGALEPPEDVAPGRPRPLGKAADAKLGPDAAAVFGRLGIDLGTVRQSGRRRLSPLCLDWTELRPHLGGALGAAFWSRAISEGWVVPQPGTRAVLLTPAGRREIARLLEIEGRL